MIFICLVKHRKKKWARIGQIYNVNYCKSFSSQAYEVLSDTEKRGIYDEYGEQGIKEKGGRGGGFSSPMDMFNMFFGGGASGGSGNPNKSKPMVHKLGISLEELYNGKMRKLAANRDLQCEDCGGKGGKSVKKCTECNGMGVKLKTRQMGPMIQQMQAPCAVCEQRGEIIGGKKCNTCKGKRTVRDKKILEVRINQSISSQYILNNPIFRLHVTNCAPQYMIFILYLDKN